MPNHDLTVNIPEHLKPYIAKQDYSRYSFIDHASWRFILKISKEFFSKNAHQKYLDGLQETGISSERIPLIHDMDQRLRRFNWRAIPVSGFIPPAVFMEYLSLGILPIACEMRTLDHLAYTPAPDIVHEAAGHAPIIADPSYANYLRSYGEISRKAIFSSQDMDVYQAIRHLSDTKEDIGSSSEEIAAAEKRLEVALANLTYVSEATYLSRMGWWTFEYGLIGNMEEPKIYGAGLLSSVGESYHCLGSSVKKVPFSIDCIQTGFDITRPQPQLFVAPDFKTLEKALEELADTMAFRRGGVEGLEKAIEAQTVTTVVLETGVQVSGILKRIIQDSKGRPCFIKFEGPTQISFQDEEIEGQGTDYHRAGFSSPLEALTESQLTQAGFKDGQASQIEWSSGIVLKGRWTGRVVKNSQLILATFQECTITYRDEILFQPEWGSFDMVCGQRVTSVFGGPADRSRYGDLTGGFQPNLSGQKSNLTPDNQELNDLYGRVRGLREAQGWTKSSTHELQEIYEKLQKDYTKDWLLRYEILELSLKNKLKLGLEKDIQNHLKALSSESPGQAELIQRGLAALSI